MAREENGCQLLIIVDRCLLELAKFVVETLGHTDVHNHVSVLALDLNSIKSVEVRAAVCADTSVLREVRLFPFPYNLIV